MPPPKTILRESAQSLASAGVVGADSMDAGKPAGVNWRRRRRLQADLARRGIGKRRILHTMGTQKTGAMIAIILGIALLVLAFVYWTVPASGLPAFLPGHELGSSVRHVKHGLAAGALGIFCFVLAWFQTGPKKAR